MLNNSAENYRNCKIKGKIRKRNFLHSRFITEMGESNIIFCAETQNFHEIVEDKHIFHRFFQGLSPFQEKDLSGVISLEV